MPRASRHFLPGLVWHVTHRCHRREFLLAATDRGRYLHWLREARNRFGLCLLDYVVTSNHVHLLVKDTGEGVIQRSMQLVAGRTAQEHNRRELRNGAFWEDRYHATAVEGGEHLHRCIAYIDLNMVRAGVVSHPAQWASGGYVEIQGHAKRDPIVDLPVASKSCGFTSVADFRKAHRSWVGGAIDDSKMRADHWTEALAVGSLAFIERVKRDLATAGKRRTVAGAGASLALMEPIATYEPAAARRVPSALLESRSPEKVR